MLVKSLIGHRIAEARMALNLSQIELSALTGFGKTRISNWETGFRTPKLEESKILEKHLGVPAPYLLCLTNNKSIQRMANNDSQAFEAIPLFNEATLLQTEKPSALKKIEPSDYFPLIHANQKLIEQQAFAFELFDESMAPECCKNDIVVFIPSEKVRHNDLILASVRGRSEILFRKYYLDNSAPDQTIIKLIPNNPDWVTSIIHDESDLIVLGIMSNKQRLFT